MQVKSYRTAALTILFSILLQIFYPLLFISPVSADEVETGSGAVLLDEQTGSGETVLEKDADTEFVEDEFEAEEEVVAPGSIWDISEDGSTALLVESIVLNKTYTAPQDSRVTIKFTKLPFTSGHITIREIVLTGQQQIELGSVSNVVYDITSDMPAGTFAYDLTLPVPADDLDDGLLVKYAENESNLNDAKLATQRKFLGTETITISNLDHFTVFVVINPNPAGNGNISDDVNCVAAGGSAYECYDSVNAAISASSDGDTIHIRPGIYSEPMFNIHKELTLLCDKGAIIDGGGSGTGMFLNSNNITVDGCEVRNFDYGIRVAVGVPDPTTVHVNNNRIYNNNIYGVVYASSVDYVDATNNYWGDNSGPYHSSTNPGGLGDRVSNYINYTPWTVDAKPVVTVLNPLAGEYVKDTLNFEFEATDDHAITEYAMSLRNADGSFLDWCQINTPVVGLPSYFTSSCSLDTNIYADGMYKLKVIVKDTADQWKTVVQDVYFDNTNPVVTVNDPLTGEIYSLASTYNFDGGVFDPDLLDGNPGSGINDVRFRFNDPVTNAIIATFSANYNSTLDTWDIDLNPGDIADGTYRVRVIATDNVGNKTNVATQDVTIDSTAPVVEITAPGDGDLVSGMVEIRGSVEDVNPWRYYLVVKNSGGTVVAGPETVYESTSFVDQSLFSWDTTLVPDGDYMIHLAARDQAGNRDDSAGSLDQIWVTVDNTAPVVEITNPNDGDVLSGNVDVRGSVNDAHPWRYYAVVRDMANNVVAGPGTVYDSNSFTDELLFTWDTTLVPNGNYIIHLAARDLAGNRDDSAGSLDQIMVTVHNVGSVQGRKYTDHDMDGLHDGSEVEERLDGWMIRLYDDGWSEYSSMVTGDDSTPAGDVGPGQFKFTELPFGTYYVCEVNQEGWTQTGPELGSHPLNFSGDVMNDAEAVANMSGAGDEGPTCIEFTIDEPDEMYSWTKFGNFEYGVLSGFKFSDRNANGRWDLGEFGIPGWEIRVDDTYSVYTDRFGRYEITDLEYGEHEICEVGREGWLQTYPIEEDCYEIDIEGSGEVYKGMHFGNTKLGSIQGLKFWDLNRNGVNNFPFDLWLSGWTITLYDSDWRSIDYMTTGVANSNINSGHASGFVLPGQFRFTNLVTGTYYVCEVLKDKWIQTKPVDDAYTSPEDESNCYRVHIFAGEHETGVQFGNFWDFVRPTANQIEDMTLYEGDPMPIIEITGEDNVEIKGICFEVWGPEGEYLPSGYNSGCDYGGFGTSYTWTLDMLGLIDVIDTSMIQEGLYHIEYWVIDGVGNISDAEIDGLPETDEFQVIKIEDRDNYSFDITIENVPPTVELNANQTINETETASFTGSFDDPSSVDAGDSIYDDAEWSVSIDYGDGTVLDLGTKSSTGSITIPNHTYGPVSSDTTYTVTLTVCEAGETILERALINPAPEEGYSIIGEGECSTATVEVTVLNNLPTVTIAANPGTTVYVGTAALLTPTVLGGNAAFSYLWTGDCNTTSETSYAPSTLGSHTCYLQVTDSDGDTGNSDITIQVIPFPGGIGGTGGTLGLTDTDVNILGLGDESDGTGSGEETVTEDGEVLAEVVCDATSKASGYIFEDENGNGEYDEGEKIFGNITVKIYMEIDGERKLVKRTDTDENGYWEEELCPGEYEVEIVEAELPDGYEMKDGDVLSLEVKEGEDSTDVNIIVENPSFFANFNWLWCLIPLVLLLIGVFLFFWYSRPRE